METKGNGAQYIPVWLSLPQWRSILRLVDRHSLDGIDYDVISDAIEWAEDH